MFLGCSSPEDGETKPVASNYQGMSDECNTIPSQNIAKYLFSHIFEKLPTVIEVNDRYCFPFADANIFNFSHLLKALIYHYCPTHAQRMKDWEIKLA